MAIWDRAERLALNCLSLEQAGKQLREGWLPVMMRFNGIDASEDCHLLMRQPSTGQEFVVVQLKSNMPPVTMNAEQICRWIADHSMSGVVRMPVIRSEDVAATDTDAARTFATPAALDAVTVPRRLDP